MTGEIWRLPAYAESAEQVYLAVDRPTTANRWIEMSPVTGQPSVWSVQTSIAPGRHRFRYYAVENGAYLNHGSAGLVGERISDSDPAIKIDDMMQLAASA